MNPLDDVLRMKKKLERDGSHSTFNTHPLCDKALYDAAVKVVENGDANKLNPLVLRILNGGGF